VTTSSYRMRKNAESMLSHVKNDVRSIDLELATIGKELELLQEKLNDATWAGDSKRMNRVYYPITLRKTMRDILKKRKIRVIREEHKDR
jgi:hypothetical protein